MLINKSISISKEIKLPGNLNLELNYKYLCDTISKNIEKDKEEILIDECDVDNKDKLYLFSPVALILSNIKKEFEKSDFEVFNKGNFYVELLGNYLEEILLKLNCFVNKGGEETYIKENKIKFGCDKGHFYLCCQLNEQFKKDYYNNKIQSQNMIIENKINNINIIKMKKIGKDDYINEQLTQKKSNKIEDISKYMNSKVVKENFKTMNSFILENKVNNFIINENDENLQNLVLFFNLKIPKIVEDKIVFESVKLSFSEYTSNFYGFREIDICFKNKNKRTIENDILTNNICYLLNENGKFKEKYPEEIDVFLQQNSIVFAEVKNFFPFKEMKESSINDIISLDYINQLKNLIKKSILFFNFFYDEELINENDILHILYLYDEANITLFNKDFDIINDNIRDFLKNQYFPKKFKNVIFQIAYFDVIKNSTVEIKKKEDSINKLKK